MKQVEKKLHGLIQDTQNGFLKWKPLDTESPGAFKLTINNNLYEAYISEKREGALDSYGIYKIGDDSQIYMLKVMNENDGIATLQERDLNNPAMLEILYESAVSILKLNNNGISVYMSDDYSPKSLNVRDVYAYKIIQMKKILDNYISAENYNYFLDSYLSQKQRNKCVNLLFFIVNTLSLVITLLCLWLKIDLFSIKSDTYALVAISFLNVWGILYYLFLSLTRFPSLRASRRAYFEYKHRIESLNELSNYLAWEELDTNNTETSEP